MAVRNKSAFLIIACVCGAIAAVGASQLIGQSPSRVQMTEIFVAAREIDEGTVLTADMMSLEPWPADRVPEGATRELSKLEKMVAGQRFFAGEPVMLRKLTEPGKFNASQIPEGYTVVALPSEDAKAVRNLVHPGDHVNVTAWFSRGGGAQSVIPETGVQTILRGVKVYAIDGRTTRGPASSEGSDSKKNNPQSGSILLLIPKADEEAWTYASELGRIRLSISGPNDTEDNADARMASTRFLQWLNSGREAAEASAAAAPLAQAPQEPPRKTFRMLKLHGGQWTQYEIAENSIPTVSATSGSGTPLDSRNSADHRSAATGSEPAGDQQWDPPSDLPTLLAD